MIRFHASKALRTKPGLAPAVDPRTGQLLYSIHIAHLIGNYHMGPDFSLELLFRADSQTAQFGKGFYPNITRFNRSSMALTMRDGGIFYVKQEGNNLDPQYEGSFSFVHDRPEHFKFSKVKDNYFVHHKDGTVEKLSGVGPIKCLSNIFTPLGYQLDFRWVENQGNMHLKSISDSTQKLLNVRQNENIITFDVFPESVLTFSVMLTIENNRVIEIRRDATGNPMYQNIQYCDDFRSPYYADRSKIDSDAIWLISNSFSVYDEFLYDFSGLIASNGEKSPRIKQHAHEEFIDKKKVRCVKRYAFSDTNFLGANGITNTQSGRNKDVLYDTLYTVKFKPYSYYSTETWTLVSPGEKNTDGKSEISRNYSVKRIYSRFHFLLEESIRIDELDSDGLIVFTAYKNCTFDYSFDNDKLYENQVVNFDKMNKNTIKISHSINKSEKVQSENLFYDDAGNVVRVENSAGIEKQIEYYPATGEPEHCPAEANGFVKYIKKITCGKRIIEYEYASIGGENPCACIEHATVCTKEIFKDDLITTHEIENVYDTQKNTLTYGRVIRKTVTYPESDFQPLKVMDLKWSVAIVDGREIITCEKHFDAAGKSARTTKKGWYVPDYHVAFEVGVNDNKNCYKYTRYGQIEKTTLNENGVLTKPINYNYHVSQTQLMTTLSTTEQEAKNFIYYDSNGRVAEVWLQTPSFERALLIHKCVRDITGKKIQTVKYDYKTTGELIAEETQDYFYNIWGILEKIRINDDLTKCYHCDPVADRITSYISYADDDGKVEKSAINFMQYTDDRISIYGRSTDENLSTYYENTLVRYDEYGRVTGLISQNERKPVNITYNKIGQIDSYETNYGCKIDFGYSVGIKNPAMLKVMADNQENSILSCYYDRWGRTILSDGDEYHYDDIGVSEVIRDRKQVIGVKYNTELNKVSAITMGTPEKERNYKYNDNALITSISEVGGKRFNEFTYDELSHLKNESSNYNDTVLNTNFTHSVCGRIIEKDDMLGEQVKYSYDESGRLVQVEYNDLAIINSYDVQGRIKIKKTSIKNNRGTLLQNYQYDKFGRCEQIIVNALSNEAQKNHSLDYHYNNKDKLIRRIFKRSNTIIRDESYIYDENGRLQAFICINTQPLNADGKRIQSQHATWDGFSRLLSFTEYTNDNAKVERFFSYNEKDYPLRITSIRESTPGLEFIRNVSYDTKGRVTSDGFGYTYGYDNLGRLISSHSDKNGTSHYEYDCQDRLIKITNNAGFCEYTYHGGVLTHLSTDKEIVTYLDYRAGYKVYTKATKKTRYVTRSTDSRGDTLFIFDISDDINVKIVDYLPWRDTLNTESYSTLLSNEYYDQFSDCYICGNGLRYYNPRLKQFLTPDILSPLKGFYINTYSYCNGDPVNLHDPSGTLSLNAWGNILLGGAVIAGTLLTDGTAGVAAATIRNLTLISGATSMASGMLEHADPHLSTQLQMASLGFGAAAMAGEVTKFALGLVKNDAAIERAIYQMHGPAASATDDAHGTKLYSNFMGKGIVAYQAHSEPSIPYLLSFAGELVPAWVAAEQEILPLIQQATAEGNFYSHPDTPLLLVACSAGRSGSALEVANVIRRPVAAFLQGVWNYSGEVAEIYANMPHSVGNYPAYKATATGTRIKNWLRGIPNTIVAPYHIYYPDDFFDGTHDIRAVLDFNTRYYS